MHCAPENTFCGRLQNAPVNLLIVIMINADIFAHIHPLRLIFFFRSPYAAAFCLQANLYSVSSRCHLLDRITIRFALRKFHYEMVLEFNGI